MIQQKKQQQKKAQASPYNNRRVANKKYLSRLYTTDKNA